MDETKDHALAFADGPEIASILSEVCAVTGMGFAAVARVTESRWVACQVLDRIEFGMDPGDELEIAKTICTEVRGSGCQVIIDNVAGDPEWRTHPVPIIYGFKSYASLPIILDDGSFFGTLCTIDPAERPLSAEATVRALQDYARRVAAIISAKLTRS